MDILLDFQAEDSKFDKRPVPLGFFICLPDSDGYTTNNMSPKEGWRRQAVGR